MRLQVCLLALAALLPTPLFADTPGAGSGETVGPTAGEAPPAEEEPEGKEKAFKGPPQEPKFTFELYQRAKLEADLDKGDASIAVYRTGISTGFSKWFGYIRAGASISAERSDYQFDNGEFINSPPDPPLPDDPFDVLSFVRLNLNVLVPFGRSKWSLFAFGGVRFGWENGTELDQGLSGTAAAAIGYRVSKSLSVNAGILVITRIEGDPLVIPIVGLRWTVGETFRLETRGPGIEAGFKPWGKVLEFTLGARFDNRQFRLEDRRRFLAEAIIEDQEVVVEFGMNWNICEGFTLGGLVGFVAYQEFEARDADGDTLYKSRTDLAPYLQLGLTLRF